MKKKNPQKSFHLSRDEIPLLIKNTSRAKHRILLEMVYNLDLTIEEATNLRLSDLDLISGEILLLNRIIFLPERLQNLLKFFITQYSPEVYLFETPHGKLQQTAAKKIIQTIHLRNLEPFEYSPVHHNLKFHFQHINPPEFHTSFISGGFSC